MIKEKLFCVSLLFVVAVIYSVCNTQQATGQTTSGKAIKLVYNYPADKPVKYVTESKIIQTMDVMGQSMQINVNSVFGCTVKGIGPAEGNLKLEVTIDTLGQNTESPMGSTGGPVKDVQGKVFNIIIKPEGKSVDISEAEKVVYTIEGSGESNLSETFINFFPVLPANEVKAGDTWSSTDSISTNTSSMSMKELVNSENKLEGFETIDGIEYAKISSLYNGTRVMNVRTPDVELLIKGPFTGTAETLFSVKDGYFIRQVVTSKLTGNIEMTYPEAITFPVVMDINSVNEVK